MKQQPKILHVLLGVATLSCVALLAIGRLGWRKIRNWWKNLSKWIRRLITFSFVLYSLWIIAHIVYTSYDRMYGRVYWQDKELTENLVLHRFRTSKGRVYNQSINEYTTPMLNWVSCASENDSLAVYAIANKRGFINLNNGEIFIDAKKNDYCKAWNFSEGLAAVMKDGKIGFINAQNEVVIPFQFDYSDKCRMWDFGYLFHNGYCIMTNKQGRVGLIDSKGEWVVQPTCDEIWKPTDCGYRIVINDAMYGVLDSNCNVIYSAEYNYIDILSDGFILEKDGKKWQVDFEGNVVNPFMFDATYYLNYPIGYDDCGDIKYAFADYVKYQVSASYGIMNRSTGKPVTPAIYSDINMLSKDLFEVRCPMSGVCYLLDINGNFVSEKVE